MDWSPSFEVRSPLELSGCTSPQTDAFRPSKKQRLGRPYVTEDAASHSDPSSHGLYDTTEPPETAIDDRLCRPHAAQQKVCFGMIYGVCASIFKEGRELVPNGLSLSSQSKAGHLSLFLWRGDLCCLTSTLRNTRTRIGVLDVRTARCLNSLSTIEPVSFDVFLLPDDAPAQVSASGDVKRKVAINVYGLIDAAVEVGRLLSKGKLYLQQPDALDDSIGYENPHFYKSDSQTSTPRIAQPVPVVSRKLEDEIDNILDSLSGGPWGSLPEYDIDGRITTQLLRHQKQAVAFMARLETDAASLWERGSSSIYQHNITGLRTKTLPDVTRGGILADTMGLGKSLTTLATILRSLDYARASVEPQINADVDGLGQRYPTKTTLIVVPLSLLSSWAAEIEKHVSKDSISVHRYHGPGRIRNPMMLREFDIILTSYQTVTYEHSKGNNVLGRLNFFRVVLDEAHIIRNRKSRQFLAMHQLSSNRRWCLTGTPLQNKLEDLESLIRFIRVSPFDKGKDFQKYITVPLKTGASSGPKNLGTLLRSICLRRTMHVLETLPGVTERIRTLELSPQERIQYMSINQESRDKIDALTCSGNTRNVYQSFLNAILRLRLLCNHGAFGASSSETTCDISALESQFWSQPSVVCSQCGCAVEVSSRNPSQEDSKTCSHEWCQDCFSLQKNEDDITGGKRKRKTVICPLCDCTVTSAATTSAVSAAVAGASTPDHGSMTEMDFSFDNAFSTKITAVVDDIENSEDKGIVFSFWTKTLDQIGDALKARGISFMRLDGSCNAVARKNIIHAFHNEPTVKTLLMTTGVGAVGLNLTVANRIHLVEPQWNPMVELQAIGRAHRLGQKKAVNVFRYIMKDTIEERVQTCRSRKLQLAMLTLGSPEGDKEAQMKDRFQSLRALL